MAATGRALADLQFHELLQLTWWTLHENADKDERAKLQVLYDARTFDEAGNGGRRVIDDPDLPEQLQGLPAPSWARDAWETGGFTMGSWETP